MTADDQQREPIEALAEEFSERVRRGESVSVEDYAAAHPELADEIRDLFPMILALESAKQQSGSVGGAVVGGRVPERLGDYHLLREIGRGGMGIVYEAEQASLGRMVAVKVLPESVLGDARQVQRFEREARTAARLHHTNIVPIFGVGTDAGMHYYVMQYIRGVGLDVVARALSKRSRENGRPRSSVAARGSSGNALEIGRALAAELRSGSSSVAAAEQPTEEREPASDTTLDARFGETRTEQSWRLPGATDAPPTRICETQPAPTTQSGGDYWRGVAEIGIQVAEALAYAHAQGTLHRDIKPANLLLDADGVVWVADFGLARAVDHGAVTQAGDVVGTLRYMAPEQFRGESDPRCDIYSLGITLYELATLTPAFAGASRGEVVSAIMAGKLPTPRSLGCRLPRDLETVLLKATARDAKGRYASAQALADDLRRFLEDRPVRARRATLFEQGWRWARRNPVVAGLSGSVAFLLLAVTVVSFAAYLHGRRANLEVLRAFDRESAQRARAQEVTAVAVDVLDAIFDQLAPVRSVATYSSSATGDDEADQIAVEIAPEVTEETAALLGEMLTFYEKLASAEDAPEALRPRIAAAQLRIGEIYQRLREREKADAALLEAYELLHAALEKEDSPELRFALARACYLFGRRPPDLDGPPGERRRARRPDHAERNGRRLRDFRRPPRPGGPPPLVGPPPEGPPHDRRAPEDDLFGPPDGPPPAEERPPNPRMRGRDHPNERPRRARPPEDERRVTMLREAVELLERLQAEGETPAVQRLLALSYCSLPSGGHDNAVGAGEDNRARGIALFEDLVAKYPDVLDYRFEFARELAAIDPRRLRRSASADLEASLSRAATMLEQLVAQRPQHSEYAIELVGTRLKQSRFALHHGAPQAADAYLTDARALQERWLARDMQNKSYLFMLCLLELQHAVTLRELGHYREADELLEQLLARITAAPDSAEFDWTRIESRVRHLLNGPRRRP